MTLEDSVRRQRLAVMQRAQALGNVSQACREFGISRTVFYRWRRRALQYGPEALRPRPTRPTRWARQAPPALEHAVVAYALLWPTRGPAYIASQLAQTRWGRWRVSPSGVYAILRRSGLRTRWERLTRVEDTAAHTQGLLTERTRRRLSRRHVEAQRPGELVCLDAFYIGKLKGVGKVWQLTACDAACSYAIAQIVPRVTASAAVAFLRERVLPRYRAGHRLRALLTDGGPEWRGRFEHACRELGVEHRRTKPRHAWTNGFVERLQGTILAELWRISFRRTFYTRAEHLERDLQAYLRFYNTERPHQGYRLRGRTPASVFFARSEH